MGLNLCIGYTGTRIVRSRAPWFGIGAYARADSAQLVFQATSFCAAAAAIVVAVISTSSASTSCGGAAYILAADAGLSALTYTIAFRWTP